MYIQTGLKKFRLSITNNIRDIYWGDIGKMPTRPDPDHFSVNLYTCPDNGSIIFLHIFSIYLKTAKCLKHNNTIITVDKPYLYVEGYGLLYQYVR
jgi:hypothetical protein